MSGRLWAAVAAMVLLSTAADASEWRPWRRRTNAQPGVTDPAKRDPKTQDGARDPNRNRPRNPNVRVVRPKPVSVAVGKSEKVTWAVTGTTDPVRLTFRNFRPEIGSIKEDVVTTSGGTPNVATVWVTGRSPGMVDIDVVEVDGAPEEADPERTQQIAHAFRTELLRIADSLQNQAKEIVVSRSPRTVSRKDAIRLFNDAEDDIRRSLPYRELAPFRDAVAELMIEVRQALLKPAVTLQGLASNPDILLVQSGRRNQRVEESTFRALVNGVAAILRGLGGNSPADTVCILTTPEAGANVVFSPPSFRSDRTEVFSNSRKMMYLGRYHYEITRSNYVKSDGYVNLLLDPQRVVECTLPRTASASRGCRPITGSLDRCP
jgi:hypothetical protein